MAGIARIINEVKNGNYTYTGSKGSVSGLIDTQADVGGWPVLQSAVAPIDTSNDGMPDTWKSDKGLDISKKETNGHDLDLGYENIEVYLNSLVMNITENQK